MPETVTCERCGVSAELVGDRRGLPEGWSGSVSGPVGYGPVCPGCQYVEWHPHCTAGRVESGYGERVDIGALERGETITVTIDGVPVLLKSLDDLSALERLTPGEIGWCDYKDLGVSWTDDEEPPSVWRCPSCGGTEFEGVHRDYLASNLKGTSFHGSVEGV